MDTGSSHTILPADLLRRLEVHPTDTTEFESGDGRIIELDLGEARIRVEGRENTRIVVLGAGPGPVILGADTLQGARLAVDPVGHRLIPTRALLKPTDG